MEKENNTMSRSQEMAERLKRMFKSPYMLLVPTVIFYALFWATPVLSAIKELFTGINGGFTFDNVKLMFNDELFGQAFVNTIVFAVVSIVIQFFLALGLALLINRKFKGSSFFLFIMMIPMAIPIAAVGIIWNTGFTELGWLNSLFEVTGLQGLFENVGLLDGRRIWKDVSGIDAVFFLILVDTWTVLPSVMIIILAGLQNLNKEYTEAALVFGATRAQTVKDIVVPIIKPTIITSLLLRIISGVQVWLISVMIFDFQKVPFLVERIVWNHRFLYGEESDKIAIAYSVLVVMIVMTIATIFLKAQKNSERSNA